MADYYTLFSFVLDLPDDIAIDYAMNVATMTDTLRWLSDEDRKSSNLDFPTDLEDSLEDWSFEIVKEKSGIWIHSDYGGIDAACQFVQHLLDRFGINEPVTFEWSNTCSKPRVDAYGGGAAIITAGEIKMMSTSQWVFKQEQRIARRKLSGSPPTSPTDPPLDVAPSIDKLAQHLDVA